MAELTTDLMYEGIAPAQSDEAGSKDARPQTDVRWNAMQCRVIILRQVLQQDVQDIHSPLTRHARLDRIDLDRIDPDRIDPDRIEGRLDMVAAA